MSRSKSVHRLTCMLAVAFLGSLIGQAEASRPAAGTGPLRAHPTNPHYFVDQSGRAVYLTGSHNWYNFNAGPARLDYDRYLSLLVNHGHNFIRMWMAEASRNSDIIDISTCFPLPYRRVPGFGTANDGEDKFDLTQFNQSFFDELRRRTIAARDRGIYVDIMVLRWAHYVGGSEWPHHPFHRNNNVNGFDGDRNGDGTGLELLTFDHPDITRMQEDYLRKLIETVNDLDNVLYEITNEAPGDSGPWQSYWIRFIKSHESTLPKQHPVGMTAGPPDSYLFSSEADWISPGVNAAHDWTDPEAFNPGKVVILDNDHTGGTSGTGWIWKSFLRGHNPILMDPIDEPFPSWYPDPGVLVTMRRYMGQTLSYATRMNLVSMTPQDGLSSTRYCLANRGSEYLVYQPGGGGFSLSLDPGSYDIEWFNPDQGSTQGGGQVNGGSTVSFSAPFGGEAVLYLKAGGVPNPGGLTVRLVGVSDRDVVRGHLAFDADVRDSQGGTDDIAGVQFFIDGELLDNDGAPGPYHADWLTVLVPDGPHIMSAVVFDIYGNSATHAITVTVNNITDPNDRTPPTIRITWPAEGEEVFGSVAYIEVDARDDVGVTQVDFYVDGHRTDTDVAPGPYLGWWPNPGGVHVITVVAWDAGGNQARHTINGVDPVPNPSDSDGDGLPDAWEMTHFGNLSQGPDDDFDGDGYTNLQEYQGASDPTSASVRASSNRGGNCGATGMEALLVLALWPIRRKRAS